MTERFPRAARPCPHRLVLLPIFLRTILSTAVLGFSLGFALPTRAQGQLDLGSILSNLNLSATSTLQVALVPRPGLEVAQRSPDTQGSQLVLNGRTLPVAWSLRRGQIGVADAGLIQNFGIGLLDTREASRQPIQWFSETRTPLVLNPWHSSQFRFLDIAPLAQRFGWQMQPRGTTLQITTPPVQVRGIRQGKQLGGDRLVLDLSGPTPWQITEAGTEWVVTIAATLDPALAQAFIPVAGNRLTSLRIEPAGNQTLLRIGIPNSVLRPRAFTLPNPNRLVIDVRPDFLTPLDIQWAPGIRWRQQYVPLGGDRFLVTLLELDPRQPGLSLRPILSNPGTAVGTAPLVTTAPRSQALAAINAGFFNRDNQMPLGAIRQQDRWISSPILNRGAIAWDNAGNFRFGTLSIQETLRTDDGQSLPVRFFNSGYIVNGISRYSPDWGSTYTPASNGEIIITVENEFVVEQQAAAPAGQATYAIPADGYLLVIRNDPAAAAALAPGTGLQSQFSTLPAEFNSFPNILGAGPFLIQNRRIVLNPQAEQFSNAFIGQLAPRSAIARTAAGTLLLVAIHNRVDGPGPSLAETARLLEQLGSVDALNLDGGSSTSLYLGGQLINRAPRTAARVHNGIGVFLAN